jgi:shikimate kinase/3-dehydroquinate synthase
LSLAFRLSVALGLCSGQDAARVTAHLSALRMPTGLGDVPGGAGSPEALLNAMAQDKKVSAGELTFILARGIGDSFIARNIPAETVIRFLDHEMAGT